MKAELNERNEVVVTMSRGEAQRIAQICDRLDGTGPIVATAFMASRIVESLGIEIKLPCNIRGRLYSD